MEMSGRLGEAFVLRRTHKDMMMMMMMMIIMIIMIITHICFLRNFPM